MDRHDHSRPGPRGAGHSQWQNHRRCRPGPRPQGPGRGQGTSRLGPHYRPHRTAKPYRPGAVSQSPDQGIEVTLPNISFQLISHTPPLMKREEGLKGRKFHNLFLENEILIFQSSCHFGIREKKRKIRHGSKKDGFGLQSGRGGYHTKSCKTLLFESITHYNFNPYVKKSDLQSLCKTVVWNLLLQNAPPLLLPTIEPCQKTLGSYLLIFL